MNQFNKALLVSRMSDGSQELGLNRRSSIKAPMAAGVFNSSNGKSPEMSAIINLDKSTSHSNSK